MLVFRKYLLIDEAMTNGKLKRGEPFHLFCGWGAGGKEGVGGRFLSGKNFFPTDQQGRYFFPVKEQCKTFFRRLSAARFFFHSNKKWDSLTKCKATEVLSQRLRGLDNKTKVAADAICKGASIRTYQRGGNPTSMHSIRNSSMLTKWHPSQHQYWNSRQGYSIHFA